VWRDALGSKALLFCILGMVHQKAQARLALFPSFPFTKHRTLTFQVWRDALGSKASAPYMTHRLMDGVQLADMQFVPYEDVMGLGSSDGYSSILIPGACKLWVKEFFILPGCLLLHMKMSWA
jgi:hypothetical protein